MTTGTAGNNLTIQAGGAFSGGTDKTGGNLILSSGISHRHQYQQHPDASLPGGIGLQRRR